MSHPHSKRTARFFLALLALLLAVPICLTAWFLYRTQRQKRLNRALFAAIRHHDLHAVRALLDEGAEANARDEPHRKQSAWQRLLASIQGKPPTASNAPTALAVVFQTQAAEAEEEVRKSSISDTPPPGEPIEIVRLLLERGASANSTGADGSPVISQAVAYGDFACAKLLLQKGADPNAHMNYGLFSSNSSILTLAVGDNNAELVKDLLDRGADPNVDFSPGYRLIDFAANSKNPEIVRLLKQAGARP